MNKKYLMFVAGDANHNKYYNMEELPDGNFRVMYGRVGASAQTATYPMAKWQTKLNEKLRKGYTDVTHLHMVVAEPDVQEEAPIKDAAVRSFVARLRAWSERNVQDSYLVGVEGVTQIMVDRAQSILMRMRNLSEVPTFNARLEELATVIPRRMSNVRDAQAKSSGDFARILDREQEILNNMAAQVQAHVVKSDPEDGGKAVDILTKLGLTAEHVTDEQELSMIRKMLGENAGQLKEAYRVSNQKTEARYEAWKAAHDAREYLYFHGSKRENFFSIWSLGFNIAKYAAYGMFGKGQYFANKARKSLGYVNGGYWAGGRAAEERVLGIFRVAYASQLDLYRSSNHLDARVLRDKYGGKYDAVFAHAGPELHNDEIIVYNDAQSTIRYLLVMG